MKTKLFAMLTSLVALATAAACSSGGGSGSASKEFVFASDGGSSQEAIDKACVQPFAKAHGLKAVEDQTRSLAKLKLMVNNNQVTWNVVYNGVENPAAGDQSSLLTPLDYSVIDTKGLLPHSAVKYGIAHDIYSDVIAYNTKAFPNGGPKNWTEFFSNSIPGKIGVDSVTRAGPAPIVTDVAAAIGHGKITYPIAQEPVKKLLESLKNKFVYSADASQADQLFTSGRVVAEDAVSSHAVELIQAGQPLAITWNQQILAPDWMEVPKGAPDTKLDMEFINYCLQKRPQMVFTESHPNGPVNKAAVSALPPKIRKTLPTSPSHLAHAIYANSDYWTPAVEDQFTNLLQSIELG